MTNPGMLKKFKMKRALEKVGKPTVPLKFNSCQFHLISNSYKGQWQIEDLTEVSKTELKCLYVQFVGKIFDAPDILTFANWNIEMNIRIKQLILHCGMLKSSIHVNSDFCISAHTHTNSHPFKRFLYIREV